MTNSVGQTATSAPNFAVTTNAGNCAPTVESFTPNCGPAGTDVTITGTNLLKGISLAGDPIGADVQFAPYTANASASAGTSASPTEITVDYNGTEVGPLTVKTFTGSKLVTEASFTPGVCILSFDPTGGNPETVVTITGVGFQGATEVRFGNDVAAQFVITTKTQGEDVITATVPDGAESGAIQVLTPQGDALSSTSFLVGTQKPVAHDRAITLKLKKHLVAKGKVSLTDDSGITACVDTVAVKIQRSKHHHWKTIAKTTTNDVGKYHKSIPNKKGKYRSMAPAFTVGTTDKCSKATSKPRKA